MVVGDDRAARELAGDLRAWLAPRRVRYYPSRGVAYESHLAPPAHLVGLRVGGARRAARRRAAAEAEPPVVVVSRRGALGEGPRPGSCGRARSRCASGELLDLDECAGELVAAGYERVDQVEERGQFALRGGLLDVFPATEERAVRVDLFDIEIESLRWFSTFTQRSLGDVEEVEIAPAAELAARAPRARRDRGRHGRLRSGGTARATSGARTSPSCCRWSASARCSTCSARDTELLVAAEEELAPALSDHWSDVCAAFDDEDAHHLYVSPAERPARRSAQRARIWLSALSSGQEIELRAQSADTAARSLAEAEPQLEKLVRSGYRTVVAFPRRGEGERAAYNLGRLQGRTGSTRTVDAGARSRWSPRCASPPPRCARASSRPR